MTSTPLSPEPTAALNALKKKNTPLRVLTIDGGALRGIVPATILSFLDGSFQDLPQSQFDNLPAPTDISISADGVQINSNANTVAINVGTNRIWECFDLIVGTSAGGLVTVGVTVPNLDGDILDGAGMAKLFYQNGASIFPLSSTPPDPLTLVKPQFDNVGLAVQVCGLDQYQDQKTIPQTVAWGGPEQLSLPDGPHYGNPPASGNIQLHTSSWQTLADAKTNVMITSFNNGVPSDNQTTNQIDDGTPSGPVFLNNDTTDAWGNAISVLQACMMTSAFPLLLPPVPSDLGFCTYNPSYSNKSSVTNYFLDGGLWAGNPAMATYLWLTSNGFAIDTMVSLGCGTVPEALTTSQTNYVATADYGTGIPWAAIKALKVINPFNFQPGWLATAQTQTSAYANSPDSGTTPPAQASYINYPSALTEALAVGGDWEMAALAAIINNSTPWPGEPTKNGLFVRIDPSLNTALPAWCSSNYSALLSWTYSAVSALFEQTATNTYQLLPQWAEVIARLNPPA